MLATSAYERELMALVLAMNHWRPYLIGKSLWSALIHAAFVTYLSNQLLFQHSSNGFQNYWTIVLQWNTSGICNKAADALSRKEDDHFTLSVLSFPIWLDWDSQQIISVLKQNP